MLWADIVGLIGAIKRGLSAMAAKTVGQSGEAPVSKMQSALGDRAIIAADASITELKLKDFRPEPMVKLAEHPPQRFPRPAIAAHSHLGRWLTQSWSVADVGALLAMMDEVNVRGIVNRGGRGGGGRGGGRARDD